MPDRHHRDPDSARVAFATARMCEHAERELHLLELAVSAGDDEAARRLELDAYRAFQDFAAIVGEHELDR